MVESCGPCCRLFGQPPEPVNFIIVTGLPHTRAYKRILSLLKYPDEVVSKKYSRPQDDYPSLVEGSIVLFDSRNENLSRTSRIVSHANNTCRGFRVMKYEGCRQSSISNLETLKEEIYDQLKWQSKMRAEAQCKTRPTWIVFNQSTCMEREFLNIFLQNHRSESVSYSFTVLCILGDEEAVLNNCLSANVTSDEYNLLCTQYQKQVEDFFTLLESSHILQERTKLIQQNELSTDEQIQRTLYQLPSEVTKPDDATILSWKYMKNLFMPSRRIASEIRIQPDVSEQRLTSHLESLQNELQQGTSVEDSVYRIIDLVLFGFNSMTQSNRNICQRVLILGSNSPSRQWQPNSIASTLIRYALELLDKRDDTKSSLIFNLVRVICILGSYSFDFHKLIDGASKIFTLSLSLISRRDYVLVLVGLKLCATILKSDRLKNKYAIAYLKHDENAVKTIMDAVEWLLSPYGTLKDLWDKRESNDEQATLEQQCLKHACILVDRWYLRCITLLLNSPEVRHCFQIEVQHANRLIEAIDILVDQRLSHQRFKGKPYSLLLACDLCTVLSPLLQRGLPEVSSFLTSDSRLLKSLPQIIQSTLSIQEEYINSAVHFYTLLIQSIRKDVTLGSVLRTEKETVRSAEELQSSSVASTTETIASVDESSTTIDLERDLITFYFELNRKYHTHQPRVETMNLNQAEMLLRDEWEKATRQELQCENDRLSKENNSKAEVIRKLEDELERTKKDRDQYRMEYNELLKNMAQPVNSTAPNTLISRTSGATVAIQPSNEIADDDRLEKLHPREISVEDAKRFIQAIYQRRVTFKDKEMRQSICGSLRQLGSDLYTSSIHFLYELIQNAEDNVYSPSVTPSLRIVIHDEFILFSNNEEGLKPTDIKAICSLAVSTKVAGKYLGEKGVGFKSVFAVSNEPTIISHPWKFTFKIPGPDEMSYIAPVWIEDADMPNHLHQYTNTSSHETHLYLPLKLKSSTDEAREFLRQVARAIDPCLLISLKRLQKLCILNETDQKELKVSKTVLRDTRSNGPLSPTFEGFQFRNLTKSTVELNIDEKSNHFYVYTADIPIPDMIKHREGRANTQLLLAFPCDKKYDLRFKVYAGLPVCDLGFNFLLNGDFQLVTSREAVRENTPFNVFLRDHFSALFVYILLNDSKLKKDAEYYCPSNTTRQIKHKSWWLVMVDNINQLLFKHFQQLLDLGPHITVRLFNADLAKLVSNEQLSECANIHVINPDNEGFCSEERLRGSHIEQVSVIDILSCFPSANETSTVEKRKQFQLEARKQNHKWWQKLFHELDKCMTDEVAKEMCRKPIFLLHSSDERQYLPSATDPPSLIFISDDSLPRMWKRQLILLKYASDVEQSALVKSKHAQTLTKERFIQMILHDHLQLARSPPTIQLNQTLVEEIWQDLVYLRSNRDQLQETIGFLVPVKGRSCFLNIQRATLPTILGVPLEKFLVEGDLHVIDYPYYETNSEDDVLKWEMFFLQMGCQKPMIHLPEGYKISELPLLRSFSMFPDVKLAEKIFSSHLIETQRNFCKFPICVHENGEEKFCPVAATFDKSIVSNFEFLPQVDVPLSCNSLARMLGVSFDKDDPETLVKILSWLNHKKSTNTELYVKWLHYLEECVYFHGIKLDEADILTSGQIYLPDNTIFRCLKDLLVMDNDFEYYEAAKQVSEYLQLGLISPSINRIYWQFKDALRMLGCSSAARVRQLFHTIHLVSQDKRNFHAIGDGRTILKKEVLEVLINLYQYCEYLIRDCVKRNDGNDAARTAIIERRNCKAPPGSPVDLEWRFTLYNEDILHELKAMTGLEPEHQNFPIPTIDQQVVVNASHTTIYACMEPRIIGKSEKDYGKRYFVLPIITRTCPLVLAALDIPYLEQRGVVEWNLSEKTSTYYIPEMRKIFQETMNDRDLEVICSSNIKVKLLLNDFERLSTENNGNEKRHITYQGSEIGYSFWIFNKTVVLSLRPKSPLEVTLAMATWALTTLLHKRRFIPIDEAKLDAQRKIQTLTLSQKSEPWTPRHTTATYYYKDILFPTDDDTMQVIPFVIREQGDNIPDRNNDSSGQTWKVHFDRRALDEIYRKRVKESQVSSTFINEEDAAFSEPTVIDFTKKLIVGENAEHFFFRYLQHRYGAENVTPKFNWRSSIRLKVFPECLGEINDSIGYDFELDDTRQIFASSCGQQVKKCYFEVKGTGGAFNSSKTHFNVSKCELEACEKIALDDEKLKAEAYFIVIVQYCLDPDKISLYDIINWSEQLDKITRVSDRYICQLNLRPIPNRWDGQHNRNAHGSESNHRNTNTYTSGRGSTGTVRPNSNGQRSDWGTRQTRGQSKQDLLNENWRKPRR